MGCRLSLANTSFKLVWAEAGHMAKDRIAAKTRADSGWVSLIVFRDAVTILLRVSAKTATARRNIRMLPCRPRPAVLSWNTTLPVWKRTFHHAPRALSRPFHRFPARVSSRLRLRPHCGDPGRAQRPAFETVFHEARNYLFPWSCSYSG